MSSVSPETLTRLFNEHGAALVLYARQWCAAPEDVVQEGFLLLARQSVTPENPAGWLYRVVRNGAISASRSAGRRAAARGRGGASRRALVSDGRR